MIKCANNSIILIAFVATACCGCFPPQVDRGNVKQDEPPKAASDSLHGIAGTPARSSIVAPFFELRMTRQRLENFAATLNADSKPYYSVHKLEFNGAPLWLIVMHLTTGASVKHIGLYVPSEAEQYRLCLFAESCAAGNLHVDLDPKSGLLSVTETAFSTLEGQIILSCNLRTIGTAFSIKSR